MEYRAASKEPNSHTLFWFAAGIGVGAIGYALLDQRRGAARRHMLRDKAMHYGHELVDRTQRRAHDLKWRAQGKVHETRARMQEHDVPDYILLERVRAQIGRPVSHPRALRVSVDAGVVTLAGPILKDEVHDLLSRLRKVRGVRSIRNHLEPHSADEHIPALQGGDSHRAQH